METRHDPLGMSTGSDGSAKGLLSLFLFVFLFFSLLFFFSFLFFFLFILPNFTY